MKYHTELRWWSFVQVRRNPLSFFAPLFAAPWLRRHWQCANERCASQNSCRSSASRRARASSRGLQLKPTHLRGGGVLRRDNLTRFEMKHPHLQPPLSLGKSINGTGADSHIQSVSIVLWRSFRPLTSRRAELHFRSKGPCCVCQNTRFEPPPIGLSHRVWPVSCTGLKPAVKKNCVQPLKVTHLDCRVSVHEINGGIILKSWWGFPVATTNWGSSSSFNPPSSDKWNITSPG